MNFINFKLILIVSILFDVLVFLHTVTGTSETDAD